MMLRVWKGRKLSKIGSNEKNMTSKGEVSLNFLNKYDKVTCQE